MTASLRSLRWAALVAIGVLVTAASATSFAEPPKCAPKGSTRWLFAGWTLLSLQLGLTVREAADNRVAVLEAHLNRLRLLRAEYL